MSDNVQRETAKIIRFPIERRVAAANAQSMSRRVAERPAVVNVESGSAWYHDAAMNDGMSGHR